MSRPARFDETAHRVHDYKHLVARWRRVARAAGLEMEAFARSGGFPVHCLRTRARANGGLYASAGIHGDEPAAAEGLLRWAETRLPALVRLKPTLPLMILPCLNPWGLVNNRREDEAGQDLNRVFDRTNVAPVGELRQLLARRHFDVAVHLHEDYDARGNYLYELHTRAPDWGAELLAHCAAAIPIDPRGRIDGRPFKNGVALRRANLQRIPLHPEAIYLYLRNTSHVFTFETPSEFSLARRVRAHVLLMEGCVRRLLHAESADGTG